MSAKRFGILVADDSEDDRFFVARALRRCDELQLLHELPDGQQAIGYLKGEGIFADRSKYPLPDLLLLDLKMPLMDGFDVLAWMKQFDCKPCMVVVFSSSPLPEDARKAFDLGADYYQLKPQKIDEMGVMVEKLRFFLRSRHPAKGNGELAALAPTVARPTK